MNKTINLVVIGNYTRSPGKVNLDAPPLGITYSMKTPSERVYAHNKFHRWFWNSIDLKTEKVMQALNEMQTVAQTEGQLILGSEYHNYISHVDVILEYLEQELKALGYCVDIQRSPTLR